jgi:DNA-binding MarR family transcriptional regulator
MDIDESPYPLHAIARDCIAVRVRLINRVVTGMYDEALRPLGVKVSQMNILVAVSLFGPSRPADICRVLRLDPSTLSRNVERMKKNGWVETVPGEDARSHVLTVQPEGTRILEKASHAWAEAQERVTAILGEEGVSAIHRLGDRLLGLSGPVDPE